MMKSGRRALLSALLGLWATTAALGAAVVRGPYLQVPTPDGITVRWATDEATDSRVRFGTAPEALDETVTVAGLRLSHEVRLTGLAADTRYFYAVGSSSGDSSSGESHTFVTAPPPGSSRPIRIWTFGDSGEPTAAQAAVRDAFTSWAGDTPADLFLLLGDNAYEAGTELEYDEKFFHRYPDVLAGTAVFSTLGNHEGLSSRRTDEGGAAGVETGPYFELFTFPAAGEAGGVASDSEAFYSFDYGNLHVICLDSESASRAADGLMAQWLEQDLAANDAEWTIAIFHHPVYSRGGHDSDTDTLDVVATNRVPDLREVFLPLLEAGGVDLVLMGHSHSYERSYLLDGHYGFSDTFEASMRLDEGDGRPDGDGPYRKTHDPADDAHSGTVYAVVGTGESVSPGVSSLHPAMVTFENVIGSLVVDVDGSRLDGRFLDAGQNVLDHFTIVRGDHNLPPVANDDHAAVPPAGSVSLDVLANDYDPDDDPLVVELVSQPQLGSVVDHGDGTVTYTAPPDLPAGTDVFTYVIGDGRGLEATGTVTVAISCPPELDGVFADDVEPEPEAGWTVDTAQNGIETSQTWTAVEDPGAASPTHSWFSASDNATRFKDDRLVSPPLDLSAESSLEFRHRYDFEVDFDGGSIEISLDGGFSWQDLGGAIVSGGYTGTVNVYGGGPVWTGVSGEAMTPVRVDLSGFAGEGRLLRWRLRADDFTIFPPTQGWWIDDVRIDGLPGTPGDCNLAPIAVNDEATTDAGTPVNVAVLANDSDPDGDAITVLGLGTPQHGTAVKESDDTVTYSPDAGFVGVDVFGYTITDGALTATAAVSIEVEDPGAPSTTAKGNGDVLDAAGRARFAFHVRSDLKNAWLRFSGGVEIHGDPTSLSVTGQTALIEGGCETAAGAPCAFTATAFDSGQPGNAGDTFAIEVRDASGTTIWEAAGPVDRGGVRIR